MSGHVSRHFRFDPCSIATLGLSAYARAVEAEHADLGAVVEAERDVAQDLFIGRDNLPNTVHGVDDKGIGGHRMILRERVIVNGYSWLVSRD